ncbi:hypothetical protein FRC10_007885 [Ceratobasidium sp. 414]|nr:hypothetical protein FRC10_007885 [Ceratobasidium sp. 414]
MFFTLTYPVEQPYRLRWITEIFYAGSVVLSVLLVVFNVALVGYDSVTVMISDLNITGYEQWWAPKSLPHALKFRAKPGECDVAKLPTNTPLRTNTSLPFFPYGKPNYLQVPPMMADEFSSTTKQLQPIWLAVGLARPPSRDTLQGQPYDIPPPPYASTVPELGSMEWDSRLDDRAPTDRSWLKSWKTYTDGIWYEGVYIHSISTTIVNIFVAIRDAIHLDVGYVTPTNIHPNQTAFNNIIALDDYRSTLTPLTFRYSADDVKSSTTCSWGWGCTPNFNISWAQALTSTNDPVNNIT